MLDKLIFNELQSIKWMAEENWKSIDKQVMDWAVQKSNSEQQITQLNDKISNMENEIEVILMERIRDKPNADRYDRMLEKREQAILKAREQIANYQDMELIETGGDVSFDTTPYLHNRAVLEA